MDKDKGLYHKYNVTKSDGTPIEGGAFVLRPETDPVARYALRAYAERTESEALKRDLILWLEAIERDLE